MSYRSERTVGGGSQYPTLWSNWAWNEEHLCYLRYRLVAPGQYGYEYRDQSPEVPRDTSNVLNTIPEQQYSSHPPQGNYTTASASVETITRGLAAASFASQQPQISQGYNSPSAVQAHITTRNPKTSSEKFDPNYKVHSGHEFRWGRVFKVLWAEPTGLNNSNAGGSEWSARIDKYGENIHAKVRRFVIIDRRAGHCICLPIMTYSGKGTNKPGVHASDHTIIWTDRPVAFRGEKEKGLTKKPIRMQPNNRRHKLAEASRLNYAKLYTVEYNVKVWFIGNIHRDSEYNLTTDYNVVHPPMPTRGLPPSSEDTYAYADGGANTYQVPYSAPASSYDTSSTSYYTSTGSSAYQGDTPSVPYSSGDYPATTTSYSDEAAAPTYPSENSTSQNPSYPARDPSNDPYDRERYYDE